MAARSALSAALRRTFLFSQNPNLTSPIPKPSPFFLRHLSSEPLNNNSAVADDAPEGDLRSRIFRLRFPKRSATDAVERWVREGGKVAAPELREIAAELRRAQRYKHALEICEWMINHQDGEVTDADYAVRIDLITKVFGSGAAEEFFEGIPSTAKTSETYTTLLHSFAGAKLILKSERLFKKMKESNLNLTALPYNEMMTLYMSAGQLDKVPEVISELKCKGVSPDLFTYNLWISVTAAMMDIDGVRNILDEMRNDTNSNNSWLMYMTLTEIYVSVNQLVKSENTLVEAGEKISLRDWVTYDFLVILHASLGNKDKIGEIWKSLRMTSQKMSIRNYICLLSTYLILGHVKEAGDVIDQWKGTKHLNFDAPTCNGLYDAFVKAGLMSAAKNFHDLMLQRNIEYVELDGDVTKN